MKSIHPIRNRSLHLLVASCVLAAGSPALAQTSSTSAPGPLVLEELHSGVVIAPENRFTEVDGELGNLIGGSIGVMTDDSVMIGAAGYWLSDGSSSRELGYGGLVANWSPVRSGPFGLSLGTLIGVGSGTLGVEVEGLAFPPRRFGGRRDRQPVEPELVTRTLLSRRSFFVAEPQARATLRLSGWLELGVGLGYRFVSGAGSLDERLRGVSGSVSLQLGTF